MKVVLFCGGLGMRMREGAASAPKPMNMIGDRPLLWHVMRYYAHFGHTDFILCLGYGAAAVKEYFLHYDETQSNDFTLVGGGRDIRMHSTDITDWNIDLHRHRAQRHHRRAADAGARPRRGRGDVPGQLRRHAHRCAAGRADRGVPSATGAVASMLAVPPVSTHHVVEIDDDGTGDRRARGARADAVGERRLLHHAAGDLRRAARGRGPGPARVRPADHDSDGCWPSATPASGARPTRSRTGPSWRRCTARGSARGCCGTRSARTATAPRGATDRRSGPAPAQTVAAVGG